MKTDNSANTRVKDFERLNGTALKRLRALTKTVFAEVDAQLAKDRKSSSADEFRNSHYQGSQPRASKAFHKTFTLVRRPRRPTTKGNPDYQPQNGEILLKNFIASESKRCGKCYQVIYERIRNGGYPGIGIRRAGTRTIFVRVNYLPVLSADDNSPRLGEISLKEFVMAESAKAGLTQTSIHQRIARGRYLGVSFRENRAGSVFVAVGKDFEYRPGTSKNYSR